MLSREYTSGLSLSFESYVALNYTPITKFASKLNLEQLRSLITSIKVPSSLLSHWLLLMACNHSIFVQGQFTDGEFCSLRSRGETLPLPLRQLIHDATDSIGKMSKATLLNMLEFIYGKNGY